MKITIPKQNKQEGIFSRIIELICRLKKLVKKKKKKKIRLNAFKLPAF